MQRIQRVSEKLESGIVAGINLAEVDASEEAQLKVRLAREIGTIIKNRKLTQVRAAELLKLRQPDVSAIVTGRVEKFSIGRLLRCLDRLDHRVHVSVRPKPAQERQLPWQAPEE